MASLLRDYLRLSPPFHRINVADASLSLLHARPFIFARPGFLTAHECAQLRDKIQPLKISRYLAGERFDVHTDAWRGDDGVGGVESAADDRWADRARLERGVRGAPICGANRMGHCPSFYDAPGPGAGLLDPQGTGVEIAVAPDEGLAVVHFPACSAAGGGWTDYNAFHEAEPAVDEKWVLQAFIWSHERLHWPAILDDENLEPDGALSSSRL